MDEQFTDALGPWRASRFTGGETWNAPVFQSVRETFGLGALACTLAAFERDEVTASHVNDSLWQSGAASASAAINPYSAAPHARYLRAALKRPNIPSLDTFFPAMRGIC